MSHEELMKMFGLNSITPVTDADTSQGAAEDDDFTSAARKAAEHLQKLRDIDEMTRVMMKTLLATAERHDVMMRGSDTIIDAFMEKLDEIKSLVTLLPFVEKVDDRIADDIGEYSEKLAIIGIMVSFVTRYIEKLDLTFIENIFDDNGEVESTQDVKLDYDDRLLAFAAMCKNLHHFHEGARKLGMVENDDEPQEPPA